VPKPSGGSGFAQETFPRIGTVCHAGVDYLERHGVPQDGVQGPVGDTHSAPAQLVKAAVIAPHNLVMIETAVIRP
jgi:hypothetical protein